MWLRRKKLLHLLAIATAVMAISIAFFTMPQNPERTPQPSTIRES